MIAYLYLIISTMKNRVIKTDRTNFSVSGIKKLSIEYLSKPTADFFKKHLCKCISLLVLLTINIHAAKGAAKNILNTANGEGQNFAVIKLTSSKSDVAAFFYFDRFGTLHPIAIGKDQNKIAHVEKITLTSPLILYYAVLPYITPILIVPGDTLSIEVKKQLLTVRSKYSDIDAALKIPVEKSIYAYQENAKRMPLNRREQYLDSCYQISTAVLKSIKQESNRIHLEYLEKAAVYIYLSNKITRKAVDKSPLLYKYLDSVEQYVRDNSLCYTQEHKNLVETYSIAKWGNDFNNINYLQRIYDSSKVYFGADVRNEKLFSLLTGMRLLNKPYYNEYRVKFLIDCNNDELLAYVKRNFNPSSNKYTDSISTISKEKISLKTAIIQNKGNVIYIDVWASWCLPCRREIPNAKKLIERFRNSNLKYFFISIDDNYDSWIDAVQKEGLQNLQNSYIVSNTNSSSFIKDFSISTIPRYLLIDKSGNIVTSNAKGPGDGRLITEIEKLLK